MEKVVILGGGPAGMMAAIRATHPCQKVILVEGNDRMGSKLRLTGGGRCNLTHEATPAEFLKVLDPKQARFLRPALHALSPRDLREWFRIRGLNTAVRPDGKVFPIQGDAQTVTNLLVDNLEQVGVELRLGTRVMGILGQGPRIQALQLSSGDSISGDRFILATGGASYTRTGSRGEALHWLGQLGLPIVPWHPALAPISLVRPKPEWMGVCLRNGCLCLRSGPDRAVEAREGGDIVFTRNGLSGPAALAMSQRAEKLRRKGSAYLHYLLDSRTVEELDQELQSQQRSHPKRSLANLLHHWLPERMCTGILESVGLVPSQRLSEINRSSRKLILHLLTNLPLGSIASVPLDMGEVSAGGLNLQGVDAHSMRVKAWENLWVCGELLDLDGPIGGYNLQIAFSTGWLAGQGISNP